VCPSFRESGGAREVLKLLEWRSNLLKKGRKKEEKGFRQEKKGERERDHFGKRKDAPSTI